MRNIRRALRITFLVVLAMFLHYVLPQQDVGRIVGTEIIRTDFSGVNRIFYAQADAGGAQNETRDLRLINTVRKRTYLLGLVRAGDQTMVYRNEDTGWIYPPYFKFDSSDLQAEANDLTSTSADPQWVAVTHYGWRIRWLTVFPNAVSIREVSGPDYRPIPWVNLLVLAGLVALGFFLRAMWAQFRERTIDPITDAAGDRIDRAQAGAQEQRGRIRRWLGSWKS